MRKVRGIHGTARAVVFTIIPEEFQAAREALGAEFPIAGTSYYSPQQSEDTWDIVVAMSGDRSNLGSNGRVKRVIDDLRPSVLIVCGIGGGLRESAGLSPDRVEKDKQYPGRDGVSVGDVVYADIIYYGEFVKLESDKLSPRPLAIDPPSNDLQVCHLLGLCDQFALTQEVQKIFPGTSVSDGAKVLRGAILSTEKLFAADKNPIQYSLVEPYPKAVAVDMESAGAGRAVHTERRPGRYDLHYVVVRGISDLVPSDDNQSQREQARLPAARSAAVVTRELLSRMGCQVGTPTSSRTFAEQAQAGQ